MFKVFISMVLQAWRLNRIIGDNSLIGELDPLKNNGQVSLLSKHTFQQTNRAAKVYTRQEILSNIILISKWYDSDMK